MTELHTGDVDGVHTFWVDTGRPTLAASLVFRQGMVDETFTTSGSTHLLEHMCLHGRTSGALSFNGSVGMQTTDFSAHGPPEEVASFLDDVTAWLAAPDLGSLAHERRVLAAEQDARGLNAVAGALTWRFGARGPGLVGQDESALHTATPEQLRALAGQVFTRGNAVLVLDGPPPADLSLHLPDGDLQQVPAASPCDDKLPASYRVPNGLTVSGLVPRSVQGIFLARWLEQRLRRHLRDDAGAAYAPWSHYEPVDQTQAVVFGGSDVTVANQPALARGVLDLVRGMRRGPDAETLEALVAEYVQGLTDPYQAFGVAVRAGRFVLDGREPQTLSEIVDEVRAVTGPQIGEAAGALAESLLVGLPPNADASSQLPQLRPRLAGPGPSALRYRSANAPLDKSVLTVAPDAVRVSEGDEYVGASVERAVGLLQVPDGGRKLVDEEGWALVVEPTMWRDGDRAVKRLDRLVPAHLHVPHPERAHEDIPKPAPFVQRYREVAVDGAGWLLWVALLVLAAVAGGFGLVLVVWLAFYLVDRFRSGRQSS